ncbi:MAG: DUF1592 domain-containing protein [Phycisphaera sp.]|nr:DUF1592 domain-containing protein [Phycisphaera sp.]
MGTLRRVSTGIGRFTYIHRSRFARAAVVTAITLCALGAARAAEPAKAVQQPDFERDVWPYFKANCVGCHGEKKQKGHFRLDELSRDVGGPAAKRWADVMERISNDEMPPDDVKNRPTADESAGIIEWLAARIKDGEAARLAKRERVSFHRLSRAEYANTIYDLLGVHYDVADPGGLSEDPDWHGFDRIGSVLTLSASHVEKYFAAAEAVLDEAYPAKPVEPAVSRKNAMDLRGGASKSQLEDLEARGLTDKVRVDMWPGHRIAGGRPGPGNDKAFREPGVFKVRLQLSGLKPADGRAPHLSFYADKLDRMLFEQDIVAPEDKPTIVEFTAHLPAGSRSFDVTNDVPGPSNLPRSGRSGRKPFISIADGRIPWQMKLTDEEGLPLYPFLILDWIEWEGPIVTDAEKKLRGEYMPAGVSGVEQARAGLTKFAERAFRRALRPGEIDRYIKLYESEVAAGADAPSAIKTVMLAIMCSKDFVYIVEGDAKKQADTLNDYELATRLSYFVWSTMPDDELLDLAKQNKLHEPAVLKAQLTRMLKHPYAARFSEEFPYQWLQLHKVGMFTPDSKLYPQYDKYLEKSMIKETTEYFREVLDKNLTLREFLVSDWTMLNPRLAMHYGIGGVTKDCFQRVQLKPEDHRGGMLTQASVLSLTSDGTRQRPVHRGKWVMESIFGKSPPPPPANVPPIEPNPIDAAKATIRMKLEAHKVDPNCAACHRKIDPLGLAFDNYNAIGEWRTVEHVQAGKGEDPKVDPSGELPDGRKFADAEAFKRLLLADLDTFDATFVKNLATFGLRRTMTFDDRADLVAITEKSKAADYRLRDTIEAFVLSDLFRKR